MSGKVTVVLDSQAGSCGKGKLIGYLADKDDVNVAINNFMSNAGHTYVDDDGNKVMTQHLPTSIINPDTILCIGPGAAVTPEILVDEIRKYSDLLGNRMIHIHPRAMIILEKHREQERALIRSGSTFKGCGCAQAEKIVRAPGVMLMRDYYDMLPTDIKERVLLEDTGELVNYLYDRGMHIMVEGSQGMDLDINYGLDYPHTTSRQCHAGQLLADCGISPRLVDNIIMIMRPYPIRISNETNIGLTINSGDYGGSNEITWEEVRRRCGAPDDIEFGEMTTVTKKLRRVFELNMQRLRYTTTINRPTAIALNFAQYIDWDILQGDCPGAITEKVHQFMEMVEGETGTSIQFIGTGARNCDMIDLRW